MLVRYLLQIILALIMMFWQSPRLTAVLLSVVPIIAIGAVQYGECAWPQYIKFIKQYGSTV